MKKIEEIETGKPFELLPEDAQVALLFLPPKRGTQVSFLSTPFSYLSPS